MPNRLAFLAALAATTLACLPARYLPQAAAGQVDLLLASRPLPDVLEDPRTPPATRAMLATIPAIKAFGTRHGLTPTHNYERFVQLHRSAVVHVVSAAPELSLTPVTWRFPIVGDVPYLGWFARRDAHLLAQELSSQGLDVDVRGVSAYSTLGWFRDPVLSTMLRDGDGALGDLANTVLHESVHATLFVTGQAAFNESLASFVADALTPSFLESQDPAQAASWLALEARRAHTTTTLHNISSQLAALYAGPLDDATKRTQKARLLAEARAALPFWRGALNNASLSQYLTYAAAPGGFAALLASCGQDMRAFLQVVAAGASRLEHMDPEALDGVLQAWAAQGCARVPSP